MAWQKGRPRPRKIGAPEPVAEDHIAEDREMVERAPNEPPADWRKGALLNVRNYGNAYRITLYPEEYSPEREERALTFTNPGECQDFVSRWYAPEHHDPRAR